ncbi:MAG TPA: response regulator [Anaeromyxobacter sp.]|nr:response regulator [Anaeromyxobacter sp.]
MGLDLLVVDDSPVTRKMVRRALSLCGLEVTEVIEAADGAEALEKLGQRHVDLVLADINMPVMNGIELVERMSRDPELCTVPVVIVATPMSQDRVEFVLDKGARAYLAKPFRPEALRDVVVQILGTTGGPNA